MIDSYNEGEATAAVLQAESFEGSGGVSATTEFDNTNEAASTTSNGFFSTPAPAMPLPAPKKHRGSILSIRTLLSPQKGTGGIEVTVNSESNGKDYTKTIWVLDAYRDNPNVDPESLKGIPAPEGKVQTPFERYGRTIQNSKGTAELQEVVNAGVAVERIFGGFKTFEEMGEVLNAALSGTPILFTDKANETETGFKVEVNHVYPVNGRITFEKLRGDDASGQ